MVVRSLTSEILRSEVSGEAGTFIVENTPLHEMSNENEVNGR